jgi:DNA-binding MarR family transcriptional regulator
VADDAAAKERTARPMDALIELMAHPGHLARRLQQASYLLWTTIVSEEVTAPQFAVLTVLASRPDIDQRTLGELASLDRSTVTDVVGRLERRGLVERVRDASDRRRNLLRLTPEGKATCEQVAARAVTMNRVLLSPLALEEQEVLMGLLRRLVEAGERLRARP